MPILSSAPGRLGTAAALVAMPAIFVFAFATHPGLGSIRLLEPADLILRARGNPILAVRARAGDTRHGPSRRRGAASPVAPAGRSWRLGRSGRGRDGGARSLPARRRQRRAVPHDERVGRCERQHLQRDDARADGDLREAGLGRAHLGDGAAAPRRRHASNRSDAVRGYGRSGRRALCSRARFSSPRPTGWRSST